MNMKKMLPVLLGSLLALPGLAQSGLIKTIGGAAKNKVEQQDFNSSRSNKEKGNLQDEKKSSPAPAPASKSAGSASDSTSQPEIKPGLPGASGYDGAYTFNQKLTYVMDDPQKPNKDKVTLTYAYGDKAMMTLMPENNMSMVVDFQNQSSIMLDEKNKTAMVMPANWIGRAMEEQEQSSSGVTVTKTGNKKVILGYNCEEYIIQDDKTKSVVWVTTEIKIDYAKVYAAMSRGKSQGMEGMADKGMMMEMTGYNKKGEADVHMIMTEYKEESSVVTMSAYKVTSL